MDGKIVPLVFDVYGNCAPKSRKFLRKMIERVAFRGQKIMDKLADKLEADLMYRIATTLVTNKHRVISQLIWHLRTPAPSATGLLTPPGEVCETI